MEALNNLQTATQSMTVFFLLSDLLLFLSNLWSTVKIFLKYFFLLFSAAFSFYILIRTILKRDFVFNFVKNKKIHNYYSFLSI